MRAFGVVLLSLVVGISTGCGFAVNGLHQDLAITSKPSGAQVYVDGVSHGTSPVVVAVKRKHSHVVRVEQEGQAVETSVSPEASMWEWGNLVFGWLLGVGIDAWTGGMYTFPTSQIHADFPSMPEKAVKTAREVSSK